MTDQQIPFSRGQEVPASGTYVCVPCGYKHSYKAGETFGECISCMAGTDEGHEEYVDGSEMWEPVEKKEE